MPKNNPNLSKPDEALGVWRQVIDGCIRNSKVRRDMLIGLALVLLALVTIVALLTTTVIAVAGAVVTGVLGWCGKQALTGYRTKRKA